MKAFTERHFHFKGRLTVADCHLLADHPGLERIQFSDKKPGRETLANLNEIVFKRRKDVALRVYAYDDTWADISFLKYLPEVERFVWESDFHGSVEPLHCLKKLTTLELGFCKTNKKKFSLTFLGEYSEVLENLRINGDYGHIETIKTLSHLKRAWFVSTKLDNFDFLTEHPIEEFGNYGSRVRSLQSLGKIKSLKSLWIKKDDNLRDIDFVLGLPNLEVLYLLWNPNLVRFPDLTPLAKLRYIEVFRGRRFEDYSGALHLKNCHIQVSGPKVQPNGFFKRTAL